MSPVLEPLSIKSLFINFVNWFCPGPKPNVHPLIPTSHATLSQLNPLSLSVVVYFACLIFAGLFVFDDLCNFLSCIGLLKALPQRLDSSTSVRKVEQSLRTSLGALQDQQSDENCLLLLKSGIMYLISIYLHADYLWLCFIIFFSKVHFTQPWARASKSVMIIVDSS